MTQSDWCYSGFHVCLKTTCYVTVRIKVCVTKQGKYTVHFTHANVLGRTVKQQAIFKYT